MDTSKLGLFRLLSRKMDWVHQRQEVVAQNIANADTPDYKPRDLTPFTFRSALQGTRRLDPQRSDPGHLAPVVDSGKRRAETERKTYETAPDGNAVVLEEQMLKVGQNNMDYQLATQVYRKHVMLLKTAIGRGG